MRIFFLTLSTLALFHALAFAWNTDPRCPGYKGRRRAFDPNEPDLRLEEDDILEMGEKVVPENHEVRKQTGKLSSSLRGSATVGHRQLEFTFMLKMYWEEGYCWQEEWDERKWCMGCEGSTCQEDDWLWLKSCDENDEEQRFVLEVIDADMKMIKLKPWTNQGLCWTRTGDNEHTLKPCGSGYLDASGRDKQVIIGFQEGASFELHPNGRAEAGDCEDACPQCLDNLHHPKGYEIIRAEPCEVSRNDRTSKWIVYGAEGTLSELTQSESSAPSTSSSPSATPPRIWNTQSELSPSSSPSATPPRIWSTQSEFSPSSLPSTSPSRIWNPYLGDYGVEPTPLGVTTPAPSASPLPSESPTLISASTLPAINFIGKEICQWNNTCGMCEGDCDFDEDCERDMICFKRVENQTVPGCSGGDFENSKYDFCAYNYPSS